MAEGHEGATYIPRSVDCVAVGATLLSRALVRATEWPSPCRGALLLVVNTIVCESRSEERRNEGGDVVTD